ncbi:MAG TPA: pantoate--beta-alanine ligase [Povalibacter sp.]|nr:pantoate--beta-alanine ligase [Povalibacter sp.]
METLVRSSELRQRVHQWRSAGLRIAFVPTMGNLHAGHGNLVKQASLLADRVIVSIFVNPLQFGPNEDFAAYPRTPDEDHKLLRSLNADLLFTPSVEEMYPRGQVESARVQVPGLDEILCGAFRPGHFTGVATIVTKLLNLVQPDVALFGEKDYQQLMIIRRAATDLCMPMEIVGVETMREPDGLAMSSRNRYLSEQDRRVAPQIFAELERARQAIESGACDFEALEQAGFTALQGSGFRPDYFSIRDAATLGPASAGTELVVLTAARIGRARLIDNVKAASPR